MRGDKSHSLTAASQQLQILDSKDTITIDKLVNIIYNSSALKIVEELMNAMRSQNTQAPLPPVGREALTLATIQEAIANIRFGVVQIIIQDGKIVQIDKTEKIRLT